MSLVYAIMMRKEVITRLLALQPAEEAEGLAAVQGEQWYRRLPLDVLRVLVDELDPKVEKLAKREAEEGEFLQMFRRTVLVGLLPVPQGVALQHYHTNEATSSWLQSYIWAVVCLKMQYLPLCDYTAVRLFALRPVSA